MRRRAYLRSVACGVALAGASSLAGCGSTSDPEFPDADVLAGPGGRLVFEPDALSVSVGDTVRWGFASSGHNVSCRPDDAEQVRLPDGAAPFATHGPEESPRSLVERGETYEHTFETAGEYRYVCVPHVPEMVGTVTVEE